MNYYFVSEAEMITNHKEILSWKYKENIKNINCSELINPKDIKDQKNKSKSKISNFDEKKKGLFRLSTKKFSEEYILSENKCIINDDNYNNNNNHIFNTDTIEFKHVDIEMPKNSFPFEDYSPNQNHSFIYKEPEPKLSFNESKILKGKNESNSIENSEKKDNTERSLIKAIAIINNKSSIIINSGGDSSPISSSNIIDYFNQLDDFNPYIILFRKNLFTKLNNFFQIKLSDCDIYEEFSNNIMKYFNIGYRFCFEGNIHIFKLDIR